MSNRYARQQAVYRKWMFAVFLLFGIALIPSVTMAQSEDDLLNSIGAELEAEEAEKEKQEKKEEEYKALKAKADGSFKSKKYDKAKEYYQQMAQLMPDRDYAKRQVQLIDQKLAEQKAAEVEEKFKNLITKADDLLAKEKWDDAKSVYAEAAKTKPDDPYPKQKIKQITTLKAEAEKAAKAAELQKKYDALISEADKLFGQKQWDAAKTKYQEASKVKPTETYPKDRQVEIAKLKEEEAERKKQEAIQAKYDGLISEADNMLSKEQWDAAKAKYQQASLVKPDESYPKEKMAEADRLKTEAAERKKQEAIQKKYEGIIAEADKLLASKSWDAAIAKYQAAKQVKPEESYPDQQITAAEAGKKAAAEAAEQAKIDQQYQQAIQAADGLLASKSWDAAIAKYGEAKQVKPSESYPDEQIAKAESGKKAAAEAAEQAKVDQEYKQLIGVADNLLQQQKWDEAIAKYGEAKQVKPSESYPDEQIAKAETGKNDAAAAAELAEYQKIISSADGLMKQQQWDAAIVKYQEAKQVRPSESYPDEQIAKAETGKKDAAAAAEQAKIDQEYQGIISAADNLLQQEQWDQAIAKYGEAKQVKPSESYPDEQIAKAEQGKKDADRAALKKQHDAVVREADALFQDKQWEASITKYEEAHGIFPEENYTTSQIEKAKKFLGDEKAAQEQQAARDQQFADLLAQAGTAMDNSEWDRAIELYTEAGKVKPEDPTPPEQIERARKQKQLQEEAEQKEKEAQELQAQNDQAYQETIAQADAALEAKEWVNAKALYQKASGFKPEESYPQEQIQRADQLAAEEQAAQQAAAAAEAQAAQEKEDAFAQFMQTGEAAIQSKSWDEARNAFQQAAQLKPEAETPGKKLEEVENLVKLEAAEQKRAEEAEAAEQERKVAFDALITQADEAAGQEQFVQAKALYQQAADMDPGATYPAGQVAEMDRLMAERADAERMAAEEERQKREALDQEFSDVMSRAEGAAHEKRWDEAIALFQQAQELKPEAQGPSERIADMEKLIAKEEADQQLAAEEARKAEEQEEAYAGLIAEADQALEAQEWDLARERYAQALKIKPQEDYPKGQIEQVGILRKQAEAEAAQRAEQERDNQYASLIAMADEARDAGRWDDATGYYQQASQAKPQETYPGTQIEAVAQLKAQADQEALARAEEEARQRAEEEAQRQAEAEAQRKAEEEARKRADAQAAKQTQFEDAVQRGDDAALGNRFAEALAAYREAEELQPEDVRLANKISDMLDKLEAEQAQAQAREAERQKELEAARKRAAEKAEMERQERMLRMRENSPEELAKRYPSGITHEVIEEGHRTITKSVIVEDGTGRQLLKLDYPWGQQFYYLNGKPVTGDAYDHNIRNYQ